MVITVRTDLFHASHPIGNRLNIQENYEMTTSDVSKDTKSKKRTFPNDMYMGINISEKHTKIRREEVKRHSMHKKENIANTECKKNEKQDTKLRNNLYLQWVKNYDATLLENRDVSKIMHTAEKEKIDVLQKERSSKCNKRTANSDFTNLSAEQLIRHIDLLLCA